MNLDRPLKLIARLASLTVTGIGITGVALFIWINLGIVHLPHDSFLGAPPSLILSIILVVCGIVLYTLIDEATDSKRYGKWKLQRPHRTAIRYSTRFARRGQVGVHNPNWPSLALGNIFGTDPNTSEVSIRLDTQYNERGNALTHTIWIEAVTHADMVAARLLIQRVMGSRGIGKFEMIELPVDRAAVNRLNAEQGKPFGQIPSVIYRNGKPRPSTSTLGS